MSPGSVREECEREPWRLVVAELAEASAQIAVLTGAIDRLAALVVSALDEPVAARAHNRPDNRTVSPRVAAEMLGVSRAWVYANKPHLHVTKIGSGKNGRLGVPVARVEELLAGPPGRESRTEPQVRPVPRYRRGPFSPKKR